MDELSWTFHFDGICHQKRPGHWMPAWLRPECLIYQVKLLHAHSSPDLIQLCMHDANATAWPGSVASEQSPRPGKECARLARTRYDVSQVCRALTLPFAPALGREQTLVSMGLPAQAGDALFIPEGWWHQVESKGVTIAVNFWWASDFEQRLGGHMDAYYLRRLVHSMLTTHTAASLASLCGEPAAAALLGGLHLHHVQMLCEYLVACKVSLPVTLFFLTSTLHI